ncbi:HAD-like domain-containing protein [Polychytrium aggregatum]|uniref:HAD-like domain-containing protein n=1 Tax=Polychytrium aggregatum TaxID=110093 RepID=UPI0022FDCFEA|nr:HAD-like domain-containing protein [Polychytrium aggregatum]KAI9205428.1 HAD-like domain-containing protein [Polychytrium aggregatum]
MVIRNVIFDLGGVILNLDYNLTSKAFKDSFGIDDFNQIFSQHRQSGFMNAFERGQHNIGSEDGQTIHAYLRAIFPKQLGSASDSALDAAWNAMLLDIPMAHIRFLQRLQGLGYRIFLLSNINEVHEKEVDRIIERDVEGGLPTWISLFERIFYSHKIGMRKPDEETFHHVLEACPLGSLAPEETVFFDDSIQHVQGARKVGIHAVHINGDIQLLDVHDIIKDLDARPHQDASSNVAADAAPL